MQTILIGFKTKKIFPNEDIIEEHFALNCRTDFTFKKHMLLVETDEKYMLTEIQIMKRKDKKIQKILVATL